MANIKSAQKSARQAVVRRERNLARKSSLKTAVKKVLTAIDQSSSVEQLKMLLIDAEAKIARAKGKGLLHSNTASRKISRLAKKVAEAEKAK